MRKIDVAHKLLGMRTRDLWDTQVPCMSSAQVGA